MKSPVVGGIEALNTKSRTFPAYEKIITSFTVVVGATRHNVASAHIAKYGSLLG